MSIPDYQTLMLPVLEVSAGGEISVRQCVDNLASRFNLTEEERRQLLPSGRQSKFSNRVHWAKSYLVHAGLIEATRRGFFQATALGRQILERKLPRIDNEFLAQFEQFRAFRTPKLPTAINRKETDSEIAADIALGVATPEELIDAAYTEFTKDLQSKLFEQIQQSDPAKFEQIVIDLLMAMGYGGAQGYSRRVGGTGDGGIDGIISEDALGLGAIYVQTKRYAPENVVGEDKVREFSGSLMSKGATKGVFVTASKFSEAAKRFAANISQQKIALIDGAALTGMMVQYGVGVRKERTIELKKLDLDYFDDEDE